MLLRIKNSIPNTITLCNLLCGIIAIIYSFSPLDTLQCGWAGWQCVAFFIGLAAVADFLDGFAARLLHARSDIGAELDSLADIVSFGVAPALLMFNLLKCAGAEEWLVYASLFIPLMGALRLAKFNVDTTQTTSFRGLPIPANAIFWIGFAALMCSGAEISSTIVLIAIVIMGLLMVCNMRMFSLKFANLKFSENFLRYLIAVAAVAFVAIFGLPGLMYTIILYILLSVAGAVIVISK